MPNVLREAPLLATPLRTQIIGSRVLVYSELDSTNDRAFRVGGDGTVIVADRQTAGRGRHGRSWHSAPGLGLWFSVVFDKPVEGLALGAPLCVRDALSSLGPFTVKWPNDVLIAGRKVCGILVERRNERTVLGIGINVHHAEADFPEELRNRATSIEIATGRTCDRGTILRDVLTLLDEMVIVVRGGGAHRIRQAWADACDIVGKRVRCAGHSGIVVAMEGDGALILQTGDGAQRVPLGGLVEVDGA